MTMVERQVSDDSVLHGIEILELVHENGIPARSERRRDWCNSEKLGGLEKEPVEVHDVPLGGRATIAIVELLISVAERLAAKSIAGERLENALMEARRNSEAPKNRSLIGLVGDSKAFLKSHLVAKLAEELGAEGMDRPALDGFHPRPELTVETLGDFAGRLIGESKDADSGGVEIAALDKESNPFDEAVGLARSRTRPHEQRLRLGLDCSALSVGRYTRNVHRGADWRERSLESRGHVLAFIL
jgi:hypothetical protein